MDFYLSVYIFVPSTVLQINCYTGARGIKDARRLNVQMKVASIICANCVAERRTILFRKAFLSIGVCER